MSSISAVSGSSDVWAAHRAQHQAKMFAKVDTDGSGGVDQTELDTMLTDISQKTGTSLGDSKELFSKMDSNGDGSLSSDELDQGMKALLPPPSTMDFAQSRGANGQVGGQGDDQTDDLFAKLDTNGDGSVDKDELKVLTDKIKADTGQDVSDQFSQIDTDGDGKISKDELAAGKPQGGPEGTGGPQGAGGPPPVGGPGGAGGAGGAGATASSSQTYDPLDTNEDGTVSEMERLAGALKELASASNADSSSGSSEIAKLAQKLYEQINNINNNLASVSSDSTTTLLSATA